MAQLLGEARGFLAADGFTVAEPEPGLLVGSRTGEGRTEHRRIWVGGGGAAPWTPSRIATSLRTLPPTGAGTQSFLLVPQTAGLSQDFLAALKESEIALRVPVQLFDTPYKHEPAEPGARAGADAASVFRDFARASERLGETRIPQPFHALSALGERAGGFASGPDLVAHLLEELSAPVTRPRLIVVAGAAGAGKSVAFAALFSRLHQQFLAEKRAHRTASRPVLFLPQHIHEQSISSLSGLLAAVARTDAAAPTRPDLMRWLNAHGHTTWMFDGLDEFFSGETDFLPALEEQVAPGRLGRIVVCTRDSLLTSSSALGALVDRHMRTAGQGTVAIYELDRWQRPAQRALAYQKLEGRTAGPADRPDPPRVAAVLRHLDDSPAAAELATLPFYCDLLLGLSSKSGGKAGAVRMLDEQDLLARAVDAMIDREAEKLADGEAGFAWDVFSGAETFADLAGLVEGMGHDRFMSVLERGHIHEVLRQIGRDRLIELVEGIAHLVRCTSADPGSAESLSVDEIQALAALNTDVGLDRPVERRVPVALVQLAFFGPGARGGAVSFSHEIVADYLAARHAARSIALDPDSPAALARAVGPRRDLEPVTRSIFVRTLAHELARDPALARAAAETAQSSRIPDAIRPNVAIVVRELERLLQ